jgi:hypothetical protein
MKIAHLILAHKDPALVERLVKKLQHKDADIYILLDAKSAINDFIYIENTPNTYFVDKRIKTVWGNYSIIESTLNGFEYILNSHKNYTHINLLSGQDYPLKPIEEIHRFLFANSDKTFMRLLSINDNEWDQGKERLAKYSLGDYRYILKYKLQYLANTILPRRKIPLNLRPYGGSQWLTITPQCAIYTINFLKNNPQLKRFFRSTWAIDEIFFQTILMNSPLWDTLVNNNLRFIEQAGNTRPTIFTMNDAERLIISGKFFARKFDNDVDTQILDYLDTIIDYPVTQGLL